MVRAHPYALEEWNIMAAKLTRLGILSEIDGGALAVVCMAMARWRDAEESLAKYRAKDPQQFGLMTATTNGNKVQSPLVGTANKAMNDYLKAAAEFGMTPSARSRIESLKPGENSNPFAGVFGDAAS